MGERCGADVPDDVDEYNRDERVETYYHLGTRELAERIVELEDELGANVDGVCTGMHADVAEAHAEIERLDRNLRVAEAKVGGAALFVEQSQARINMLESACDAYDGFLGECDRYRAAWKSARLRAKRNRSYADSDLRFTRGMWSDAVRDLARYRLAWLSARRRAADEANMGQEAVDHIRRDRDRWRSGHETAEAQLVWERRDNARLRSFAEEVKGVHYSTRDGEPDCAERFLKRVYDSMYELWGAEREKRQFVDRLHRRAARGEFDDVADDERETTDAPRLEHMGTEEDGGTVWQLAAGPRIR